MTYSRTFNDYAEPVEIWTEVSTDVPCGLDMQSGNEDRRTTDTLIQYDAVIRLPLSEGWDEKDRIKITKRFGEDTTDLVFEIASPIQRGPSGIRLLLKKVSV